MKKAIILVFTHGIVAVAGFVLGIYLLPILTAPATPTAAVMADAANQAEFRGQFQRDLKGSDFLHWGEGELLVGSSMISLQGKLAPGPDYKLYLSPVFVENEAEFLANKSDMVRVGDVRTFENFVIPVPSHIRPADFNVAVVWCESFGEFISAASYQ